MSSTVSKDYELFSLLKDARDNNDKKKENEVVNQIYNKWLRLENKMYNTYKARAQKLGIEPSFEEYKSDAYIAMMKAINNVDLSKVPDPSKWNFYFPLWGYINREIITSLRNKFKNTVKNIAFSLDDSIDGETTKGELIGYKFEPIDEFEKEHLRDAINEAIKNSYKVFDKKQARLLSYLQSDKKLTKADQIEKLKVTPAEYNRMLKAIQTTVKIELSRSCNKRHIGIPNHIF